MAEDRWLSIEGAAERVGRSRSTIYRWIDEGMLTPCRDLGSNVRESP